MVLIIRSVSGMRTFRPFILSSVKSVARQYADLRGDEQAAGTFDQPAQSNITAVGIFHALQQLVAQTLLSATSSNCAISLKTYGRPVVPISSAP